MTVRGGAADPVHRDPADLLPPGLLVDTRDRATAGIRISLPARPVHRPAFGPRVGAVHERPLARYGAGWAAPESVARSPGDPLGSLEYVVVDVETTGGSVYQGHRITEVCAVRLRGDGRFIREFSTLVNPERPIPAFITALTRISRPMVEHAPRFDDIVEPLGEILAGAVFVAHNASFDWRFISREMERTAGWPLRGRVLCTVRLARKVVPEISRRSLDALSWFFSVENEARHRAFGDARATAAIFRRMLERLEEREIERWEQLEALLARRAPRRKRRASPQPMTEVEIQ